MRKSPSNPRLSLATLPKSVQNAEYAVRGEIVQIAAGIQQELDAESGHSYPFEKLVPCNIGNPQSVGQKPLTFHRQVLSELVQVEENENPGRISVNRVSRKQSLMSSSGGMQSIHEDITSSSGDLTLPLQNGGTVTSPRTPSTIATDGSPIERESTVTPREIAQDDDADFIPVPSDVVERGREFRQARVGSYSHSKGHPLFRRYVAEYIDRRDGGERLEGEGLETVPRTDIEDLFLTDGASPGIKTLIELLVHDENDVILIPIPQYPLYSASITRTGGSYVGYELEENYQETDGNAPGWRLPSMEPDGKMDQLIEEQVGVLSKRCRAISVINPGNPTGNVLSREEIIGVIRFAERHGLVILADEVYQSNVYSSKPFISFRQVVHELGSNVELFSFHSISKGFYGECGLRGGYMHLTNISQDVNAAIYKLMSMNLCSNTIGQAMVASIMAPPDDESQPSYQLYKEESEGIFSGLRRKALILYEELNKIRGIQTMPIEGAMYAFPDVKLPKRYVEYARNVLGKEPDTVYCIDILKKIGVITVPGNGFGQRKGSYHFRLTILPEEEELRRVLKGLSDFQEDLYREWGGE